MFIIMSMMNIYSSIVAKCCPFVFRVIFGQLLDIFLNINLRTFFNRFLRLVVKRLVITVKT